MNVDACKTRTFSPLANVEEFIPTDIERSLIGAFLCNPENVEKESTNLKPSHFGSELCSKIYKTMLDFLAAGTPITLELLVEKLHNDEFCSSLNIEYELGNLMQSGCLNAHVSFYSQKVRQYALRRRSIDASEKIKTLFVESKENPETLLSRAESFLFDLQEERSSDPVPISNAVQEAFKILDDGYDSSGTQTGFLELDSIIGGLRNSELTIVAARPSMGKTAFALNLADSLAVDKEKKVLFFSLEMSQRELTFRLLSSRSLVPCEAFRRTVTSSEARQLNEAGIAFSQANLYIDDSSERTVSDIASIARRMKRENGLDCVVIDYIGLIVPDDAKLPRQEQVAYISKRLKALAKDLDISVVCLSQLNRMTEQSKDNRPKLSNLRESGAIEQDADVVMFVHREEYYLTKEEAEEQDVRNKAEIIVSKNRNGKTGTATLKWQGQYCLFSNLKESSNNDYEVVETFSEFDEFEP